MAAPAAILNILVRANTGQATSALYAVNAQLGATEKRASKLKGPFHLMEKALVGSSVAVGAGMVYAVKKAAEFEQQMARTAAVAPATAEQMQKLEDQAIRQGRITKFSALEAAQAQAELVKGGLAVGKILRGGLQSALALASAGEMELSDAAIATVNAMQLFNLRGRESMKVADQYATAANNTTAEVADFAWAMRQGGSAAKAAGLDFTDTVAVLEALAAVGIRNSDAGTSLKTTLIQLARPTDRAKELMKKLGLSFFDANGDMKSMTSIAGMLQKQLEPLNKQQRLHAFAVLAGTDGMRTLNALFEAGPQKMRHYREQLKEQGTAAEIAKKKQDNLYGTLEKLQGSIDSVAIAIGRTALPVLRRLATAADHTADRISHIINRGDLSVSEKIEESFRVVKIAAAPWIKEITRVIRELELPRRFGEMVTKATPVLAQAFGHAAGRAAISFVQAFLAADIWGRLVLGGWLLSKMGGLSGAAAIGKRIGGALGMGMGSAGKRGGVAGGALAAGVVGKPVPVFVTNPGFGAGGGVTTTAKTAAGGAAAGGTAAGAAAGAASGASGLLSKIRGIAGKARGAAGRFAALDFAINLVDSKGNPISAVVNTAHDLTFGITPRVSPKFTVGKASGRAAEREAASLAARFGNTFSTTSQRLGTGAKAAKNAQDAFRSFGRTLMSLARPTEVLNTMRQRFQQLAHRSGTDMKDFRSVVNNNMRDIKRSLGLNSEEGRKAVTENFRMARQEIRRRMQETKLDAKTGMGEVKRVTVSAMAATRRVLIQESMTGQKGLSKAFRQARNDVRDRMSEAGKLTKAGMREIRKLLNTELKAYGLSSLRGGGPNTSAAAENARGLIVGNRNRRRRGGPITGGEPHGDTVPAMLERGEYVLNRKAVQKVGKRNLDRVNFADAPRFQTGGMIAAANRLERAHFPYVWGGGHQGTPAPFGPMDCSGAVSYVLQHGGVKIPTMVSGSLMSAGKPGPGAVTVFANPTHTFMRIAGRYFGTSGSNPGGGAGWFPDPGPAYRSRFVQRHFAGALGGAGMGQVPKVTLTGLPGTVGDIAQAAVDTARRGANKFLDAAAASADGGGDIGDAGPGWSKAQLRSLWVRANRTLGNPNLMAAIALAESGGDPNAHNPSGASGLWQILGEPFPGNVFDPLTNAKMAGAKLRSQGLGAWEAYTNGAYRQFMKRGGSVEKAVLAMRPGGEIPIVTSSKPQQRDPRTHSTKISTQLRNVLKRIQAAKTGRKARKALKPLIERLRGIELPKDLTRGLAGLEKKVAAYSEYAERAGSLTDVDGITNALQAELDRRTQQGRAFPDREQQAMVDKMTARVGPGNHNQVEWLQKQLEALFSWRNKILHAKEVVDKKREKIHALAEQARKRLKAVREQIHRAFVEKQRLEKVTKKSVQEQTKHGKAEKATLEKRVKEWKKHPAQNHDKIRAAMKRIKELDDAPKTTEKNAKKKINEIEKQQKRRVRVRDALTERILPTLSAKQENFNSARSNFVEKLVDIQGVGAPMTRYRTPPPVGTLGGQIFDVQLSLRDLTSKPIRVTADTAGTAGSEDSESVALLKEQLRLANLRTLVSQRQYEVFRDMPDYGGTFATGGVVPGPQGAPRIIEAHGGEGVFTRDQMSAMGGGAQSIVVLVQDGAVREDHIKVIAGKEAERITRQQARNGARRLPGRGGGL